MGATLIHLLTGIPPSELPQKNLRVEFRHFVSVRPNWASWLETLTEPDLERRFASAEQALTALETGLSLPKIAKPPASQVRLKKSLSQLIVQIPPRARSPEERLKLFITLLIKLILSLASRAFFFLPFILGIGIVLWVVLQLALGNLTIYAWAVPIILSSFLWWTGKQNKGEIQAVFSEVGRWIEREVGFSKMTFCCQDVRVIGVPSLSVRYYDRFSLEPPFGFRGASGIGSYRNHSLDDLQTIEATAWEGIVIEIESERYAIGKHLSEREREWIVREIEDWLAEIKRERSTAR